VVAPEFTFACLNIWLVFTTRRMQPVVKPPQLEAAFTQQIVNLVALVDRSGVWWAPPRCRGAVEPQSGDGSERAQAGRIEHLEKGGRSLLPIYIFKAAQA
jgi:hypothetical protein